MNTEASVASPKAPVVSHPITDLRTTLVKAVLDGEMAPNDFPAKYSAGVDEWLANLFDTATRGKPRGCALIAVGGYGRGELFPGSDLDLVLVHHARRDFQRIARELWYAIWDIGMHLDHSVRTRREALSVASGDLKVILGLLDGRVIAGDTHVTEKLFAEIPSVWRRNAAALFRGFDSQIRQRHEQFGELAFLLEPDLKQSNGGLRDLGVLRALVLAVPQLAPLVDRKAIADAERTIAGARVVVHCRTNSANDRLLLQEQDVAASLLGFGDADELMAAIAESGRTISSTTNEAWRRARNELQRTPEPFAVPCSLGNGVLLRDGEVTLDDGADVTDPALVIAIGRASVEHNLPISLSALETLAEKATAPAAPWSPALREGFVALLSTGPALIPAIEALDQYHLFELLFPEWTAVRNRPQRNAYHRFTIDRHLLETVALAAEKLDEVGRPDLLIMGALLHDIGKGFPGDHSEGGSVIALEIARRMGFAEKDATTLSNIVAYHLVLPEFATRRDLADPSTSLVVAQLLGKKEMLDLLAALTEVDSRATGPAAWGPWKAELVAQLVERVALVLIDGVPIEVRPPARTPEQLELLAAGELGLRIVGNTVTVVAPDRPGLLSIIAGALALNGCNVRRATLSEGTPGMAIDVFQVEPAFDRPPDWDHVQRDLASGIENTELLDERLAERDLRYAKGRRRMSAMPTRTSVRVDNKTSALATIIEVQTLDRLGLLHDIASVFANKDHDVVAALVDTLGHEVVDTFYVRKAQGEKLDAGEIEDVTTALESVISCAV